MGDSQLGVKPRSSKCASSTSAKEIDHLTSRVSWRAIHSLEQGVAQAERPAVKLERAALLMRCPKQHPGGSNSGSSAGMRRGERLAVPTVSGAELPFAIGRPDLCLWT
jgi:hypothetical protein